MKSASLFIAVCLLEGNSAHPCQDTVNSGGYYCWPTGQSIFAPDDPAVKCPGGAAACSCGSGQDCGCPGYDCHNISKCSGTCQDCTLMNAMAWDWSAGYCFEPDHAGGKVSASVCNSKDFCKCTSCDDKSCMSTTPAPTPAPPVPTPAGSACTGSSFSLLAADCAGWQGWFDDAGGKSWDRCNSTQREDPCSCSQIVTCSNSATSPGYQQITSIDFQSIPGVSGTVSPLISGMKALRTFVISGNKLGGKLPDVALGYAKLDYCQINNEWCTPPRCNSFTCPLPAGAAENCGATCS